MEKVKRKLKINWLAIGAGMLAAGAGIYFLIIRKKNQQNDKYGNVKLKAQGADKEKSGGIAGGVQTTKGGSATAVVEPSWDNPFDKDYSSDVKKWIAPKSLLVLKDQFAKQYAKELYNAKSFINDDEEAVENVFKKVKDKVHVSNVSAAFWRDYQKDLYDYLASFLSEAEMEKYVMDPVRKLPNYRTS
jgi:hypothetical protein